MFLLDTSENVTTIVEQTKEELSREIADCTSQLQGISTQLADLKRTLYAKFGNVRSIGIQLTI